MTEVEERISRAYAAFNARDIDGALEMLQPDVEWANGMEGGHVYGHEAVREYWTRQWTQIDPRVEPLAFSTDAEGRTVVEVLQQVRKLSGETIHEGTVFHVYTLEDGLVSRMDIQPTGL